MFSSIYINSWEYVRSGYKTSTSKLQFIEYFFLIFYKHNFQIQNGRKSFKNTQKCFLSIHFKVMAGELVAVAANFISSASPKIGRALEDAQHSNVIL